MSMDSAAAMRRKSVEAFADLFPQQPGKPDGTSLRGAFLVAVNDWAQAMDHEASQRALAFADLARACAAVAEVRKDRAK